MTVPVRTARPCAGWTRAGARRAPCRNLTSSPDGFCGRCTGSRQRTGAPGRQAGTAASTAPGQPVARSVVVDLLPPVPEAAGLADDGFDYPMIGGPWDRQLGRFDRLPPDHLGWDVLARSPDPAERLTAARRCGIRRVLRRLARQVDDAPVSLAAVQRLRELGMRVPRRARRHWDR